MKYLIIDTQNVFHRAMSVCRNGPIEDRASLALHITLLAVVNAWNNFNPDHIVFCLESRNRDNWRKKFDERYKANRQLLRDKRSQKEAEDQDYMFEVMNNSIDFFKDSTNASILRCPIAEADDLIARWINLHPDDNHIIISSDKDFFQLNSKNVAQFSGLSNKVFYTKDTTAIDFNTVFPREWEFEEVEDADYALFEKIVRGDSGDNVFSAYPRVRKKAREGKPSIISAYNDRFKQGYDWNNFMMHKWTDHHDVVHIVKDDFERNTMLVDLNAHPEDVRKQIDEDIIVSLLSKEEVDKKKVWFNFRMFCKAMYLENIFKHMETLAEAFSSRYPIEKLTGEE